MSSKVFCEVCSTEFRTKASSQHIRCVTCREKSCQSCGNQHKRRGITCSSNCESDLRRKRSMERHGVERPAQLTSVREKTKKTCTERYGEDNPFKSATIKARIKESCISRYGTENPQQCQEVRSKVESTCMERYGTKTPFQSEECKEKARMTCLENYGVEHPAWSTQCQDRKKKTSLAKYGVEHHISAADVRKKSSETLRKNFGVDNPMFSDEIKLRLKDALDARDNMKREKTQDKVRETSESKYGVSHFTQSTSVKEKQRQTMVEKYGYDNAFKLPATRIACHTKEAHKKRIETMKSRGTNFQSSKAEDHLFKLLCEEYTSVQRHVPVNGWDIDFYIEDVGTYVNMNGIYWHGRDLSEDQLSESENKQSKTILGTKMRDSLRQLWFDENNKKLVIIWEDELSAAIQKIKS